MYYFLLCQFFRPVCPDLNNLGLDWIRYKRYREKHVFKSFSSSFDFPDARSVHQQRSQLYRQGAGRAGPGCRQVLQPSRQGHHRTRQGGQGGQAGVTGQWCIMGRIRLVGSGRQRS